MTNNKTDLGDLLESVELARAEKHPDLSSQFLRRVVEIEHEAADDEQAALAAIRKEVGAAVASMIEEEGNA